MTDQGWVKAGELHDGSKVLSSRKEYEVVESIEYKGYNEIEVYNLIVENSHTFFITELGLMVHNIDCKNATLGQIFKQVGDNISNTKIKGDFEDVIKKLDGIAGRNNIEEYIKNFDSRFRGLDPNNLDEIKKIVSDTSKDIDNHSSSLFKGTEGVSNPRKISGVATGGENLSNPIKSMRGSNGNIGLVPKEVADNLRGREFNSFDDFRNAFWQEYSTSSYASEFSKANIKRMSQGLAPKAPASQQYKNISSYVLHYKNPIYNGGGVYDLDNIIISSPRMHQEILDKGFHFNK